MTAVTDTYVEIHTASSASSWTALSLPGEKRGGIISRFSQNQMHFTILKANSDTLLSTIAERIENGDTAADVNSEMLIYNKAKPIAVLELVFLYSLFNIKMVQIITFPVFQVNLGAGGVSHLLLFDVSDVNLLKLACISATVNYTHTHSLVLH